LVGAAGIEGRESSTSAGESGASTRDRSGDVGAHRSSSTAAVPSLVQRLTEAVIAGDLALARRIADEMEEAEPATAPALKVVG
jgi:hypothetical protein